MSDFLKKAKERLTYIIKGGEDENIPDKSQPEMIPVLMQDGTIEQYAKSFIITDDVNCVICNSKFYHTSLDCECLLYETNSGEQLKALTVKEAKKQGFTYCYPCSREKYLFNHGRLDEV